MPEFADSSYAAMQARYYQRTANKFDLKTVIERGCDPTVGSFHQLNAWSDYEEYWLKGLTGRTKVALDFGCGPGRNIARWHHLFKRIDGVDICQQNLDNARVWIAANGLNPNNYVLKTCGGMGLAKVRDGTYDVVMSTLTLQHICVHRTRLKILKEFNRVLRGGGWITIQMGYGDGPNRRGGMRHSVPYFQNYPKADGTNGEWDTRVEDPKFLEHDLDVAGFVDFEYWIRPKGPHEAVHPNWIFFRARKP